MASYPDEVRRQERAEERKRRGWKRPVGIAALRVAELNREFTDRYGGMVLPNDDAGRDDVIIMLHHLARRRNDPADLHQWIADRAPWLSGEERGEIVARVLENPLRYRADTLAARIGLTAERRTRLKIRTIGAIDQTAEQRKRARGLAETERKRTQRRIAGIPKRPETSINKDAPWLALGICRRTWFRRRAKAVTSTAAV